MRCRLLHPTQASRGTKLWSDRGYIISTLPAEIEGAELFQLPVECFPGLYISIVTKVSSDVYIAHDTKHSYNGWKGNGLIELLTADRRWDITSETIETERVGPHKYIIENLKLGIICHTKTNAGETIRLPETIKNLRAAIFVK